MSATVPLFIDRIETSRCGWYGGRAYWRKKRKKHLGHWKIRAGWFSFPLTRSHDRGRRSLSLRIRAHLWYGTMLLFLERIAPSWRRIHVSARIYAHFVGSHANVVMLRDQMAGLEIFLRIFHSDGRKWEPGRLNVVLWSELMEKVSFSGSTSILQFRAIRKRLLLGVEDTVDVKL